MKEPSRIASLLVTAILVYLNSLSNGFTYDDEGYILLNPAIKTLALRSFFETFRPTNVFRPITYASYALNWKLNGAHALGFHLVNLLLHSTVTLLLYKRYTPPRRGWFPVVPECMPI